MDPGTRWLMILLWSQLTVHVFGFNNTTDASRNKTLLDQIQTEVGMCPQIAFAASDLMKIQLIGKGFSAFYEEFSDIDEFCDCSPYLMHAWVFKETLEKAVAGNTVVNISDTTVTMATYCSGDDMKTMCDSLVDNLSFCRRLPAQAGLKTADQLKDVQTFIHSTCSRFDPVSIECALDVAGNDNFTACFNNVSGEVETKRCGRRDCVREYIEHSCSSLGRDLYIYSVNLQRKTKEKTIKQVDCDIVDGANFSRLSTLAALGTVLLYMIM